MKNNIKRIAISINPLIIPILLILFFMDELANYIIILICAFLHELGHIITAIILKLKIKSIQILPIGISARIDIPNCRYLRQEIILYLSGPLTNLLLILPIILLLKLNWIINSELGYHLILVNLSLACLNLLPVIPLDGGRILNSILCFNFSCFKSHSFCKRVSKVLIIMIIALSILIFAIAMNISFFLVGIFLAVYMYQSRYAFQSEFLIDLLYKRRMIKSKNIIKTKILTVNTKTELVDIIKEFALGHFYFFIILNEEMKFIKIISEIEIIDYIFEHGVGNTIKELLLVRDIENTEFK